MSTVSGLCRATRVLCEMSEIVDHASQTASEDGERGLLLRALSVVQTLSFGICCAEFGAQMSGASNATLGSIKRAEVLTRFLEIPLQVRKTEIEEEHTGVASSWGKVVMLFANGLLPSLSSVFRASNEAVTYNERAYLDMDPVQLAEQRRIITDEDGNIIAKRPVTREECEDIVRQAESQHPVLSAAEVFFKIKGPAHIAKNFKNTYARLAGRLHAGIPTVAGVPLHPMAAAREGIPVVDQHTFDLLACSSIPVELHDDVIFSRHTCVISHEPIRHPAGLPGEASLYELSILAQWVREHGTSPTTRRPVGVHQIITKPAIQALIDHRLLFHQARLLEHVRQGIEIPASDAGIVLTAQAEEGNWNQ